MFTLVAIASTTLAVSIIGIVAVLWWRWHECYQQRVHPIRRYVHIADRYVVRGLRRTGRHGIWAGRVTTSVIFDLLPVLLYEYGVYLYNGTRLHSERLFRRLRRNRAKQHSVERTASAYLRAVRSHRGAVTDGHATAGKRSDQDHAENES